MTESHARFERFLVEVSFICPECGEKNIRNYSPDDVYSLLECLERDRCDKCGVGIEIYESNEPVGEIVRCRDCVHCYEDRRNTAIGWVDIFVCDSKQWSTSSLMPSHTIEPDGFCAWGERREGAES